MKEHRPEWKYAVIIEKKEKGKPMIQYCLCDMVFVGGPERIHEQLREEQNAQRFGLQGAAIKRPH